MSISDKEKQNTVGYQETLKIYAKNIYNNIKKTWKQICEVAGAYFFEEIVIVHKILELCEIFQINLSFYHLMSKHS